jgi:hypothetical protein
MIVFARYRVFRSLPHLINGGLPAGFPVFSAILADCTKIKWIFCAESEGKSG